MTRPKKTGGLSFDVTINENNSENSTSLQSAAAILREKSEKRRSRLAARHQNSNNTTSRKGLNDQRRKSIDKRGDLKVKTLFPA